MRIKDTAEEIKEEYLLYIQNKQTYDDSANLITEDWKWSDE